MGRNGQNTKKSGHGTGIILRRPSDGAKSQILKPGNYCDLYRMITDPFSYLQWTIKAEAIILSISISKTAIPVEEFKFPTPSSVFLPLARMYIAKSPMSFFHRGHFEISTKSNNVRTRGPRTAKFSGIVAVGDHTPNPPSWATPTSGFAARGR